MTDARAVLASLPTRSAAIAAHRARGGRVAAVFPIHYPRSLFRAFDVLPVEVWGPPKVDTTLGDAHLQAYTCSIVRGGLSFLLGGGLEGADMVMVPHTCDSLQGLGSLLTDFVDVGRPVLTLYQPRGPRAASTGFLVAELRRLGERLAELTGKAPSDAEMLAAVEREEEADAALAGLLAARRRVDLGERDFYRLLRSREYLPAEDFTRAASQVLAAAKDAPEKKGLGLVVSGIVPEPMEILDAIGDAGGVVVGDDFAAVGRRLYPRGHGSDPLRRTAERLLEGPPDSTRGSGIAERAEHLAALAKRGGAKAVLFFVVKFCEPELFYLPELRSAMDRQGLRSVVVEADVTDALPHQARTRVEALVETAA